MFTHEHPPSLVYSPEFSPMNSHIITTTIMHVTILSPPPCPPTSNPWCGLCSYSAALFRRSQKWHHSAFVWDLSTLLGVSVMHPFLLLNGAPLYGCSSVCLSTPLWRTCSIPRFSVMVNNIDTNIANKFFCEQGQTPRSGIAGSYMCVFNFMRDGQVVFQSCTILHCDQK